MLNILDILYIYTYFMKISLYIYIWIYFILVMEASLLHYVGDGSIRTDLRVFLIVPVYFGCCNSTEKSFMLYEFLRSLLPTILQTPPPTPFFQKI